VQQQRRRRIAYLLLLSESLACCCSTDFFDWATLLIKHHTPTERVRETLTDVHVWFFFIISAVMFEIEVTLN
jgi:hypothetical protein